MNAKKVNQKNEKKIVPPYLPFKTFKSFIEGLGIAMPNRIDRSLMGTMSGTAQGQLENTLKYLHLVDPDGASTDKLKSLADTKGEDRKKILQQILQNRYGFLFSQWFDLEKATPKELDEKFVAEGASGDTVRKGVAFFISAAREAGISLSPYISNRAKPGPKPGSTRRTLGKRGGTKRKTSKEIEPPLTQPLAGAEGRLTEFQQALLATIPKWDPEWSPEAKKSYFDFLREIHQEGGAK